MELIRIKPLKLVRGVFYGWWLVGVTALIHVLVIVPVFNSTTVWNVVLRRRFEWDAAQLSLAWSFQRMEGSIMTPLAGYLTDKIGTRRMVLTGLLILGGGFLLFSRVQELWQFYLAFVVLSAGTGMAGWLPLMTMLNNWFQRRRGLAMGIAMEGLYVGAFLLVPLLAWSIDPDKFGLDRWRDVSAGLGIAILLIAFPVTRLIRNRPEDYGYYPDGAPPPVQSEAAQNPSRVVRPRGERDYTWQEAVRTSKFWYISLGHAFSSVVSTTVLIHLGLLLDDRGFTLQQVGLVLAVFAGAGAMFNLVGGYLSDRVPIRLVLFGFSVVQIVAVGVLIASDRTVIAYLFAVLLGAGMGGRTAPVSSVRGVYFGRSAFGRILGLSMVANSIISLAAPYLVGRMYIWRGNDYDMAFGILATVGLIGACFFLLLGEPEPRVLPATAGVQTGG